MKFQRGLVCTLLMFFLFGLIANAEVSDYPSIQWSKITYTDQTAHTGEVAVSIDGVAGISIVEGQTANIPELPITFIYLFAEVEVWQNEDGSFSVVEDIGDEEVVMTRDELIQNYVEDRIQIIPLLTERQ